MAQGEIPRFELAIRRLVAGVALVILTVAILAGMMAGARIITIAYRAFFAMLVVKFVGGIVLRVLRSYGEIIDSGQA